MKKVIRFNQLQGKKNPQGHRGIYTLRIDQYIRREFNEAESTFSHDSLLPEASNIFVELMHLKRKFRKRQPSFFPSPIRKGPYILSDLPSEIQTSRQPSLSSFSPEPFYIFHQESSSVFLHFLPPSSPKAI